MALTKLPGFTLDTTANFTFATANVTGNLTTGNSNLGNAATKIPILHSKYLNYLLILLLAVNMYTSYAQDNMDALWANVTAFALLLALIGREKELEE